MQDERVIIWTIGDPSDDGHGKTSFACFKTNLSSEDILKINQHLSHNWDMCLASCYNKEFSTNGNAILTEYEEPYLSQEQLDTLRTKGFDFWGDSSNDPEDYFFDTNMFYDLIVFCINIGAKELNMNNVIFEITNGPEQAPLYGGYGLF